MKTLEVGSSSSNYNGVLTVVWQGIHCGHRVDKMAGEEVARFLYALLPTESVESCLRELASLHGVELVLEGGAS